MQEHRHVTFEYLEANQQSGITVNGYTFSIHHPCLDVNTCSHDTYGTIYDTHVTLKRTETCGFYPRITLANIKNKADLPNT